MSDHFRQQRAREVSPWRNWLARLTVNQEVGSSSLPGDDFFAFIFFVHLQSSHSCCFLRFGSKGMPVESTNSDQRPGIVPCGY